MREIIFRGKSILNGEWLFGVPINSWWYGSCSTYMLTDGNVYGGEFDFDIIDKIIPETICQYTGLKDCNGKMIFEGDIVKITDHTIEETFESCGALVTMLMTRTYEIFWNVTKWSIKSLEPMLAVDPPIFDLPTNHVTYEIIGNIHDQKEDV